MFKILFKSISITNYKLHFQIVFHILVSQDSDRQAKTLADMTDSSQKKYWSSSWKVSAMQLADSCVAVLWSFTHSCSWYLNVSG